MGVELVLAVGACVMMVGFGVVLPIVDRLRGKPTPPDGDHAFDGLGCPQCGHTPGEAGTRPFGAPWRRGQAVCWHGDDVSGWGSPLYCGCPHPFHAS